MGIRAGGRALEELREFLSPTLIIYLDSYLRGWISLADGQRVDKFLQELKGLSFCPDCQKRLDATILAVRALADKLPLEQAKGWQQALDVIHRELGLED